MKTLAIITARGGSKRIPRKNIKDFCGKPIIAYPISAAIASGLFDEVMVSTDDSEIATVAKESGASVPFLRSEQNSGDFATTNDVLEEVLSRYADRGIIYDAMCCLYPTAPFVTPELLTQAYQLLEQGAQSVMPIVQYGFPPQRAMILRNGKLEYQYPELSQCRSQDLQPIYHDCGQFYFYRLDAGLHFVDGNYTPIEVPDTAVQDIDTLDDWALAELKYQYLIEKER